MSVQYCGGSYLKVSLNKSQALFLSDANRSNKQLCVSLGSCLRPSEVSVRGVHGGGMLTHEQDYPLKGCYVCEHAHTRARAHQPQSCSCHTSGADTTASEEEQRGERNATRTRARTHTHTH